MNEMLKIVASLSLSAGLIALLLLALRPLYKNRLHKNWQYYIWLVVVARLLIPFTPETNLVGALTARLQPAAVQMETISPAADDNNGWYEQTDGAGAPIIPDAESPAPVGTDSGTTVPSLLSELLDNLWLLWLGTALVLLVRKITSYHSFTRFIKAGRVRVADPDILEAYRLACEDTGTHRPLSLYHNKLAVSPMLTGVVRPAIVLPDLSLDADEMRLVLRHELIHYRRGDILYKWLVQLAVCLHWFNPLVYLMSREVSKNCELSCDELVMRDLDANDKRQYGNTLLATLHSGGSYGDTVASVTLGEDAKLLKERLEAIIRHVRRPRAVAACSVVLATLLLCGAAFTGAYTGARSVTTPAAADLIIDGGADTPDAPQITVPDEPDEPADPAPVAATQTASFSTGSGGYYYSWQNHFFRDGYIFTLEWKRSNDLGLYPTSVKIAVGSKEYDLAFLEDVKSYRDNGTVLEAIRVQIAEMMINSFGNRWEESFFILREVSGPYTETADQLLPKFYEADNTDYFYAVLNTAGTDTVSKLLTRSYEDDRDEYFYALLGKMPDGFNADELVARAVKDNRMGMLYSLMDYISDAKKKELLEEAYTADRVDMVGALSDLLSAEESNKMLERAYADRKMAMFSLFMDEADHATVKKLAEKAFTDGEISYFSTLADELTEEELADYAGRAYDTGSTSMVGMLDSYLPSSESGAMALRAYKDGNISSFSIYINNADKATIKELAELAYTEGKISYFTTVMHHLPSADLKDYAERAYKDKKTSFQSVLMNYM